AVSPGSATRSVAEPQFLSTYSPKRCGLGIGWVKRQTFRYALAAFVNDLIDQTVLLGLLSRHNEVALHVLLDFFDRLPAVVSQELVDHRSHPQNLLRVDVNVGCLA